MELSKNYYSVLGVSETASDEEIRQAYRVAAQKFHPDVNKAPGADILFKDINTAYEALSDRQKRNQHDKWLQTATSRSLEIQVDFSRRHIKKLEEAQLLYVLLKVKPLLEVDLSSSSPLNLCLVIDRSTSMKGERLQQVKQAVHTIIDNLSSEDIVSIVAFSDDAEVLVPAQRNHDPRGMKAQASSLRADGATAILSGLKLAMAQIQRHHASKYVNHIILITDGRTYGDEEDSVKLAAQAREQGIGISGIGIGEDWNDSFLDALAKETGGSSAYIANPRTVKDFLQGRIRSLATAYAERVRLVVAPTPIGTLKSALRISPDGITLKQDSQPIALGAIEGAVALTLLLQFHINTKDVELGQLFVGRVDIGAEILGKTQRIDHVIQDLYVEVTDKDITDEPSPEILGALSNLMLYQLQDRAREAIEQGDIADATRKLEILATRLFENGQEGLAQAALHEAQRVAMTQTLSSEGAKQLKYGTRALMPTHGDKDD